MKIQKKAYTIDRLSDNLSNDLSSSIDENYCNLAMDSLGRKSSIFNR